MAKVRKYLDQVERVITVREPVVELTLTDQEVKALMVVFQNVGGDRNGPRGYIDDIKNKLIDAGYKSPYTGSLVDYRSGGIHFKHDNKVDFINKYDTYNRFKFDSL